MAPLIVQAKGAAPPSDSPADARTRPGEAVARLEFDTGCLIGRAPAPDAPLEASTPARAASGQVCIVASGRARATTKPADAAARHMLWRRHRPHLDGPRGCSASSIRRSAARVDWPWFVVSQIAFGLAAGFVVARARPLATMQTWPLAARAASKPQGRVGSRSATDETSCVELEARHGFAGARPSVGRGSPRGRSPLRLNNQGAMSGPPTSSSRCC